MNSTDLKAESDMLRRFVRLHSHDFRNHYNGIEMGLMLLELNTDPEGLACIERIRKEVNALETGLRYLENRLTTPERNPVSALDVFNQWKSRYSVIGDDSVRWNCHFSNVSICVDMRMLSDTLCEWLSSMKRFVPGAVTGEVHDNEIRFLVTLRSDERDNPASAVDPPPPGFRELIESNGGDYREEISPEGRVIGGTCSFPVVPADE